MQRSNRRNRRDSRRGAVALEFAMLAPVLLTLMMGLLEVGRTFEVQQVLHAAAREGARLGAMDRDGLLLEGQSSSDKIEADIRTFLDLNNLPGDEVQVTITDVVTESTFDFDDPASKLKLFKIHLEVPFESISYLPAYFTATSNLTTDVVFRNAETTITQ